MDLNSLNTFIAIAETGSFSEAGERLHLTQPAVSKRIAALEQQLNARLFDRVGREVNLTACRRCCAPSPGRIRRWRWISSSWIRKWPTRRSFMVVRNWR